jgi:hypothetical protein
MSEQLEVILIDGPGGSPRSDSAPPTGAPATRDFSSPASPPGAKRMDEAFTVQDLLKRSFQRLAGEVTGLNEAIAGGRDTSGGHGPWRIGGKAIGSRYVHNWARDIEARSFIASCLDRNGVRCAQGSFRLE